MAEWASLPGKIFVVKDMFFPSLRKRLEREREHLTSQEFEIFSRLSRYDLAHSLRMARKIKDDPILRKAALLHDIGKTDENLSPITRELYTLLELVSPPLLKRLVGKIDREARGQTQRERAASLDKRWKRSFYIQAHHDLVGGEILTRIGSNPEVIRLVSSHLRGSPQADPRLQRLKRLDSRN
jgi:putative nucleotidyltransferase with HDIG domain